MTTLPIYASALLALNGQLQDSAAPAAPPAFEVVRAGDSALECQALLAEINALNAQVLAIQVRISQAGAEMSRSAMGSVSRPGVGGLGMGLAGAVASFVPGGALLSGAASLLQQQASQAAVQQQQRQMMESTTAMSDLSTTLAPLANRAAHLAELARDKAC